MESVACGGESREAFTCARQHSAQAPEWAIGEPPWSFGVADDAGTERIGSGLAGRPAGGNRRQHLHHQGEQDNR